VFTGIIEELGRISSLENLEQGMRLVVSAEVVTSDINEGDSIAVNGVCLTALDVQPGSFSADVSPETLSRTTLGNLIPDSPANLERAVTPSTRMGGHFVQGHVDARGTFLGTEDQGDFRMVRIGFPPEISKYLVHKGSVAVEGISLTIAALAGDYFEIAVIPKTWSVTNLSYLTPGDPVNLEADVIAKYVERLLSAKA
jgi:riboflavin synthase